MVKTLPMTTRVDTLIVGAGVIGSSLAMHLSQRGMQNIRVIDFDLEGTLSSSELNAGGVRATWVQPINILMSKLTIEYFEQFATEVGYRPCGYLWLHPGSRWVSALEARNRQVDLGWPVQVWEPSELKRNIPFIDKVDDLAGALFSPRDGLINPNLLKNHYREIAKAHGVIFEDRTLLQDASYLAHGGEYHVVATLERFESVMSHETKIEIASAPFKKDLGRTRVQYRAKNIINCAGPWASRVARILGYESPSYPLRRQVSIFDCRDVDLTPYGMIVDSSGVYFHPEATNGLAGFATHHESQGVNFNYDGEKFFEEYIWPALYERSSCFERLKHLTGWAGLYEVSPDECAILGAVTQGNLRNQRGVYEAHSFSGHGVMQSYSAGLTLAELILYGKPETIDISPLSGRRFETQELVIENLII